MSSTTTSAHVLHGRVVPANGVYALDPAHTFVQFKVQHLVIGHVLGRFDETQGTIMVSDDPARVSVSVTIATSGISTHNAVRDEDLRSARFFDVARYPTMTYRSTGVAAELDGRWSVDGNLTIRDVTRPITLAAEITGSVDDERGHSRLGIHAEATASRKEFGLLTDLEHESGGLLLRNDIVITVDAEALLQGQIPGDSRIAVPTGVANHLS